MLSKKTLLALVLLVGQGAALYFITRSQKTAGAQRVVPAVAAKDVRRVVVTKGAASVELVRDDPPGAPAGTPDGGAAPESNWKLTKPVAYAADRAAVKTLLERIEKMNIAFDAISKKTEWHDEKFGVGDKTGTKLELFGAGEVALVTLILGKSEGGRTFLRKPGEDAVYQATGIMNYAFDKKPEDWRDKVIFDAKDEDVSRVEVKGAETLVLERDTKDKTKWTALNPAGLKLDQGKAQGIARTMAGLRAKEFAEGEKPEATGLSAPEVAVIAHLKSGKALTLLVGKKKGQADYYVKRADAATVFVVGAWQVEQLNRKPADVKEKEPIIAKPAGADVGRIVIAGGVGGVTLERTGPSAWKMTAPEATEAETRAVQEIFAEVQKLNVPEATHGGKEKHAEFDLAQKGVRVELFGTGGARLSSFIIGKEDKGQTYLRKVGDDKVYKTYGLRRAVFDRAPAGWKKGAPPAPGAGDDGHGHGPGGHAGPGGPPKGQRIQVKMPPMKAPSPAPLPVPKK